MEKNILDSSLLNMMKLNERDSISANSKNVQKLKDSFSLQQHPEGGWFAELYTAPFKQNERATAGSIYFLLDREDLSHFHQIDCDEIWYFHTGCGMKIYILQDNTIKEYLLGMNTENHERPMVVIPAGAIFAAENLDKKSYTFVSCVTTPAFHYQGFRLISKAELKERYPQASKHILQMAFESP